MPVVVKQIVGGADAGQRFARELSALGLAGTVEPPVVPRVFGADATERMLVLEYLNDERRGDEWPVEYATGLARLHAAGRDAEPGTLPAWSGPGPADVEAFVALAESLGVPAPSRAVVVLHEVVDRLGSGGRSLLHGDPCPDNARRSVDGVRFVDLEQAALGDGLAELAYLRIGYPTCWCVTRAPAAALLEAEQAYRTVWRAATGEDSHGEIAEACVGWMLRGDALVPRAERDGTDHLARLLGADWSWGTMTARERLAHRLGVVAQLSAELAPFTGAVRTAMLHRWPDLRPAPRKITADAMS